MVCRYDSITYGNYVFNGSVKTTVGLQTILADDGYVVKYYRATIDCDFIINKDTVTTSDPVAGGVDLDMDNIKATLTSHNKLFQMSYRGLGTSVSYDPAAASANILAAPVPEILNWEPLAGNMAVRCKWRVNINFSRCPATFGAVLTAPDGSQATLVSLTEEQQVDIDEDGAVNVSLEGNIEFNGKLSTLTRENLRQFAGMLFPSATVGFHRTQKYKFSKDHRRVSYVIEDKEIRSENPLFPYMLKQDIDHEIESSLMGDDVFDGAGFMSWGSSFEGRFEVRPKVWKGWAWIAFLVALSNRRNRAGTIAGVNQFAADANGKIDAPEQKLEPRQIPTYIKIKESIYSRKVDISMKYTVICDLDYLFYSTGMFYPVYTKWVGNDLGIVPANVITAPGESNDVQWNLWAQYTQAFQNPKGLKNLRMPRFSLLFDPCMSDNDKSDFQAARNGPYKGKYLMHDGFTDVWNPTVNPPYYPGESGPSTDQDGESPGGNTQYPQTSSPNKNSSSNSKVTPRSSWIKYEQSFEIIENTNNVYIPSISNINPTDFKSNNPSNSARSYEGFSINENTNPYANSRYDDHYIQTTGVPIYFVRMKGYAIRMGYSVPTPALRGVKRDYINQTGDVIDAYRTGDNNRWVHKQLDVSGTVPTFLGMWDILYALKGDPTAHDIRFNSTTNAEFA